MSLRAICTLGLLGLAVAESATLRLHPSNEAYFEYRGKPTILITSGEHYSSVLNLNFDFVPYLDELQRHGFNLTRTFSGTYREAGTSGHGRSPLSPGTGPENFISPWAWTTTPGGADGRKFDLDRWNPAYFARLRRFLREAERRGVVVELVLFCNMYNDEIWSLSPLHPDNSTQGQAWSGLDRTQFLTGSNSSLLNRQIAVARKIVAELRDVPNVYLEIANEPNFGPPGGRRAAEVHRWHETIIRAVAEAEARLPTSRRHLIAYNSNYPSSAPLGAVPAKELVSVLNTHYLNRSGKLLERFGQGQALGYDETQWIAHPRYGSYGNTMKPDSGRLEAWEFLLGGGAVYSNLNYAYQVDNPRGSAAESDTFKTYLSHLHRFVSRLPLAEMKRDTTVVAAAGSATWRAIGAKGKEYAIYFHRSTFHPTKPTYVIDLEPAQFGVSLELPAGSYKWQWIRPADLTVIGTGASEEHQGGKLAIGRTPVHTGDIALHLTRIQIGR